MPGPVTPAPDDQRDAQPAPDALDAETRRLVERRSILGPASAETSGHPLEIVEGWGTTLVDAHGVDYLDADNAFPCVGHAHPRVVEAIARQAARLQTPPRNVHRGILDYGEKLLETFPPSLDTVMVVASASEANDLALRIARAATTSKGVIVTGNAYHGLTAETAAMSPALGDETLLGGWVRVVDAPTGDGASFVADVAAAAAELRDSEYGLSALVVDPLFVSDGVVTGTFLAGAAEAVRAAGGLVVADEAQAGFGRLGTTLWGFEAHGLVPDVVTLGESMANGMPMGAVVLSRTLAESFGRRGGWVDGASGNPVSIAAAQVVLEIVETDGLRHNARAIGEYLSLGLSLLASATDTLGAIRGTGLAYGIDVVDAGGAPDPSRAAAIVAELRRRRVIIGSSGKEGHVLIVRPPLSFSIGDADRLLEQLYGAVIATDEVTPSE